MGKKVARQDKAAGEEPVAESATAPLRVLHVISGLGLGGAETVLWRLATRSHSVEHEVVCLGPRDWYSDRLEEHGIRVHHVGFSSLGAVVARATRLHRLIKSSSADVVQGWMYRGNVVGGLAARAAGKPVVWNVRSSTLRPLRLGSRILARVGGPLARWVPDFIINCSQESARLHARLGYDAAEGRTIPNGYDPNRYGPDEEARAATRAELGIEAGTFLICTIGRWHAQKGFPELLEALRLLRERKLPVRLLMVGRDLDERNIELGKLIDRAGCRDLLELLGERTDIPQIARAPDLHVLASIGAEAFPNVVAETMLSGTPNVATDVGDAAYIVGDTGWIVPPGDPAGLADAIELAYLEWGQSPDRWRRRREASRSRIAGNFTLHAMIEAYEQVWREVAAKHAPAQGKAPLSLVRAEGQQAPSPNVDAKTVAGFGREWGHFDQSKLVGEEYDDLFHAYFGIFPFDDLPPDAEGFDLGCGSGRWAVGVAPRVGRLHLIDPAEQALDVARKRLAGFDNVTFHLAPADAIPLPDRSQDFGYSLGVLHHIPDTARALGDAVRKLKPGAPFLLYIYYKLENRPIWFRAVWRGTDVARRIVSRLPFPVARGVTSAIAAGVYWPLARLSLAAEKVGVNPSVIPLSGYRHRSFYTMRTDALDRFGTRLEQRFTRAEIEQLMRDSGLTDIRFSDRMPYWVACGTREPEKRSPFSVSVVIPLYNKEEAVETTLRSVLGQTRPPDEIIIVDDGSTDGSVAIAERVLSDGQENIAWRIISQENAGEGAARNRGAAEAKSEFIAFLDADDEWLPDYLLEMEKLAGACPSASVLAMRYSRRNARGSIVAAPSVLGDHFFGIVERPIEAYRRGNGIINSSAVAIRRDAWARCGGFHLVAQTGTDVTLWLKLGMSETFAHMGRPLSIWRDEYSAGTGRKFTIPEQLRYFLGTEEGRRALDNGDLTRFLAANLVLQIGVYSLLGNTKIRRELRRLAASLPLAMKLECWSASFMPVAGYRMIAWWRRRSRELA